MSTILHRREVHHQDSIYKRPQEGRRRRKSRSVTPGPNARHHELFAIHLDIDAHAGDCHTYRTIPRKHMNRRVLHIKNMVKRSALRKRGCERVWTSTTTTDDMVSLCVSGGSSNRKGWELPPVSLSTSSERHARREGAAITFWMRDVEHGIGAERARTRLHWCFPPCHSTLSLLIRLRLTYATQMAQTTSSPNPLSSHSLTISWLST
ncbi:hypothetical protein IW261DRAFT_1491353 [Armillaria novae-zelandiae]|uniref:Uncharacterized protein n=1 Tax=Armillaria novae-zelandiae TaxID=153914 RepID=A0AA39P3F2_9AGAR|nr:hypothetical protein IW261DRAFT_1491353 [Armillaria novae-zelandiae]